MTGNLTRRMLLVADAALLVLFPVAWFAPLMTVSVTLRFWSEGTVLSVVTTLQSLWAEDAGLALLVTFLAVVAPTVKVLGMMLIHLRLLSDSVEGVLYLIGRLAMADVFLIALFIVIFKGLDGGGIVPGWGLWLFTGCVLGSLVLSLASRWLRIGPEAAHPPAA